MPVSVSPATTLAAPGIATAAPLGLGHRRIAYIRGAPSFTADVPASKGFREACARPGIPEGDTPEFRGDGQFEGGERAAARAASTAAAT